MQLCCHPGSKIIGCYHLWPLILSTHLCILTCLLTEKGQRRKANTWRLILFWPVMARCWLAQDPLISVTLFLASWASGHSFFSWNTGFIQTKHGQQNKIKRKELCIRTTFAACQRGCKSLVYPDLQCKWIPYQKIFVKEVSCQQSSTTDKQSVITDFSFHVTEAPLPIGSVIMVFWIMNGIKAILFT